MKTLRKAFIDDKSVNEETVKPAVITEEEVSIDEQEKPQISIVLPALINIINFLLYKYYHNRKLNTIIFNNKRELIYVTTIMYN